MTLPKRLPAMCQELPGISRSAQAERIVRQRERHPPTVAVRRALRAFVSSCTRRFELDEPFLDVGCGYRTNEPEVCEHRLVDFYTLDLDPTLGPDFTGPAEEMPMFRDGLFGTVLCTEVLEHVPSPQRVLREIRRVLRPGGHLLLTVPFWVPIHRRPPFQEDYWRLTPDGIKLLAAGYEVRTIELFGPHDRPEGIFLLLRRSWRG